VCPWNAKFSRAATEPAFEPRAELEAPDLAAFATMDDAESKRRFGDTPLARAKRAGLVRNAAVTRSAGAP
jgi:epoxyqueuosine reductase